MVCDFSHTISLFNFNIKFKLQFAYYLINKNTKLRWRKSEDKNLCDALKIVLKQNLIELNDFLQSYKIQKDHSKVLKTVKIMINWKGTIYVLRKRIFKIYNTSKFTSRDLRKLKKLLRDEKKGILTMNQVLDYFPGKTIEQIRFQMILK